MFDALSQISKLEGAEAYIIKRGRFMRGGVFFLGLLQGGVWALEISEGEKESNLKTEANY